jgi:sulfatase maturation enzyme AslB (radical SAM superfamily)
VYWPAESINNFLTTAQVSEFNIGIKFSNFCNLACRSCGPDLSSTYAQIKNQSVSQAISIDISRDSTVWPALLDYTKKLTETYELVRVSLIGGETMIQQGAEQYIDFLASLPNSNNVIITLTSNFTTLNDKLFKQLDHFRRFDLTASVDSVGSNYHYVRWPAQFSKIQQNIDNYIKIQKNTYTLTTFTIASVWGLNNIFYINEYLDFLMDCLKKQPDLIVHVLHLESPANIAVENLPVQYRSALLPYIQTALAHPVINHPNTMPMKVFLQGVERFLQSDITVHSLFDDFLKFTADFDQRTKCSFEELNTRLYQVMSNVDQTTYKKYLL